MARQGFSAAALAMCLTIAWSVRTHAQHPPPAFVGAAACASCHQDKHTEWKSGRHSKMLQPANAAAVVGDFSKTRVTLRGQPFQLRTANGEYFITESNISGTPREHRVDYTLGSRRIQ